MPSWSVLYLVLLNMIGFKMDWTNFNPLSSPPSNGFWTSLFHLDYTNINFPSPELQPYTHLGQTIKVINRVAVTSASNALHYVTMPNIHGIQLDFRISSTVILSNFLPENTIIHKIWLNHKAENSSLTFAMFINKQKLEKQSERRVRPLKFT